MTPPHNFNKLEKSTDTFNNFLLTTMWLAKKEPKILAFDLLIVKSAETMPET
jgi:hypothetical protein